MKAAASVVLGVLAFAGVPALALGQPGATTPFEQPTLQSEPTVEVMESYKRKIIIADSVSGGFFIAATVLFIPCLGSAFDGRSDADGECALMAASALGGLATFVAASPLIHLGEGNTRSAGLSLLLRAGLPALGFAIAESNEDLGSFAVLGGVSAAMMIDWFVLAKKEKRVPARFFPTVQTARGGMSLGLGGTF